MSKPKLNDAQKARVVELVEQKIPQTTVAQFFNVSPRTITRVLEENGMIHTRRTLSDQEKDFLALMKEHALSVTEVRERLSTPAMTNANITALLSSLTETQLGALFVSTVRNQTLQVLQQEQLAQEKARQREGKMNQVPLYA